MEHPVLVGQGRPIDADPRDPHALAQAHPRLAQHVGAGELVQEVGTRQSYVE